ncbi:hypothetical protein Tco_0214338 [Tanacetum coccineum]
MEIHWTNISVFADLSALLWIPDASPYVFHQCFYSCGGDGGTGLMGEVVLSLLESDMMTNGVNTLARGVVVARKKM